MRRPLIHLLALALGAASALLVACGSSDNPHLLSAARADRLNSELDALRDAVGAHQCQQASELAQRLSDQVTSLPRDTDPRLRQRLEDGVTNLKARAAQDCVKTTPTVTETTTQETTTETQTETTPTQTETTTTPTTTTTTPTTTTPTTTTPDSGGSTAPPSG